MYDNAKKPSPGSHSIVSVCFTFTSLWKFSSLLTKWQSKVREQRECQVICVFGVLLAFTFHYSKVREQTKVREQSEKAKFTFNSHDWSELNFWSEPKVKQTLTNECTPVEQFWPDPCYKATLKEWRLALGLSLGSPIQRPLTNWTVYGSLELLGIIEREREARRSFCPP